MESRRGTKILFWMCVAMALVVGGILIYIYTCHVPADYNPLLAWAAFGCTTATAVNIGRQLRKTKDK